MASCSLEGRGEAESAGDGNDEEGREGEEKLSMVCCNVCGWCKGGWQTDQMRGDFDIRSEVIEFYKPDIMALVETWLKGDEDVVVEGYNWFGHNRKHLHRNAVRGSGGVGVLVISITSSVTTSHCKREGCKEGKRKL